MSKKRLPKEIYVGLKQEGSGDEYWLADIDWSLLAELGETVRAGRYRLVETVEIDGLPRRKPTR